MNKSTLFLAVSAAAVSLLSAALPTVAAGRTDAASPKYPYGETGTFNQFVAESFRVAGDANAKTDAHSFFTYMGSQIPADMDAAKPKLAAIKDPQARAQAEIQLCADLHHAIKKQIPKFSLDRGFEFSNTVKLGERQCYLQSVTIAALLQRAGIPAGVAMVSRNEKGAYCNNGHAVPIARLADGTDIIVDASDPKPFMTHQGLMLSVPTMRSYAYVEPQYNAANQITAYKHMGSGKTIAPASVATLDVPFLRSQFDYYRGERAPGGMFTPDAASKLKQPAGMAESEKWLKRSVAECPRNPLSVYMLGKVEERQGQTAAAAKQFKAAYALYSRFGWIPNEEKREMASLVKPAVKAPRVAAAQ